MTEDGRFNSRGGASSARPPGTALSILSLRHSHPSLLSLTLVYPQHALQSSFAARVVNSVGLAFAAS